MNKALFRENIRRNWMISLAGFLVYFLCGPFLIISDTLNGGHSNNILNILSFSTIILSYVLPASCAYVMFSYLNKSASCSVIHSMPFNRKTLYITNVVSGFLLSIAPAFFNLLSLYLARYFAIKSGVNYVLMNTAQEYTIWFYQVFIMMLFVYAICVFAAMVCGNGVISVLTGMGFNALLPALYLTILFYAATFTFGFYMQDKNYDIAFSMHPAFQVFIDLLDGTVEHTLSKGWIYCIIAIAILGIGYFVYKKRPLENAGESYVFPTVKTVIGFLITFFVSSFIGLICFDAYGSGSGYVAFAISAIIGFILSKMIIMRSPKIFNLRNLKEFGVVVLVITLILAVFSFDILGLEKKIPDIENIQNIKLDCSYYNYPVNQTYGMTFSDEESMNELIELNQYIIDSKEYAQKNMENSKNIEFMYVLKDHSTYIKSYSIPEDIFTNYEIEKLIGLKEYRNAADRLMELDPKNIKYFNISYEWELLETELTEKEKTELLSCLSQDFKNRDRDYIVKYNTSRNNPYDDEKGLSADEYCIDFMYYVSDENEMDYLSDTVGYSYSYMGDSNEPSWIQFSYVINEEDENSFRFLKDIRLKLLEREQG